MSIVVNKTRLPVTEWQTASGSVVSISDARKRNAKSLSVALEPIQDLSHGDPSPTNICPISGRSSVSVYDDPKYGGKIWWNQLTKMSATDKTDTKFGVIITDNRNGSYTLNGTATQGFNFRIPDVTYTNGHVYLIHSHPAVCITNDMGYSTDKGSRLQVANASRYVLFSFYVANGSVFDNVTVFPFVCDLTEMFGAGNEPTLEQFRALFPKDYYPYNAGTETLVSAVNGDPYISVTLSLGQTVYDGTVDLVSGVMTLSHKLFTLNGSDSELWSLGSYSNFRLPISGMMTVDSSVVGIIACDKLLSISFDNRGSATQPCIMCADGNNIELRKMSNIGITTVPELRTWLSLNNVEIVYPLATPQTIQLTANQIEMLMRNNTVWSDAGVVTLKYARIHQ